MQDNLNAYVQGGIKAGVRRILFTKWIGEAWEQISSDVEMIVRSFRKVGIAVLIDGSKDKDEININGLEDYEVEEDNSEDEESGSEDEDSSQENDPFAYGVIVIKFSDSNCELDIVTCIICTHVQLIQCMTGYVVTSTLSAFLIILGFPVRVYSQGTSKPSPNFLCPVTLQEMAPP